MTTTTAAALTAFCLSRGLPAPVAELRFAPPRRWRFDLAWPARLLALEIDGGLFGRGKPCPLCGRRPVAAHTSIERLLSDREKLTEAAVRGWRVLLVTPDDLQSGRAFDVVERALQTPPPAGVS